MRKLGLALVALFGVLFFASSAAAEDRWYGFCQVTDHSTLSVYSGIYYAEYSASDEFGAAYQDRTERRNTFRGQVAFYCLNYQTKTEAEAELAKMVAADAGRRVIRDPLDPSTLPKLTGPTVGNAKTFLTETLLNGVSRVHPMQETNTMRSEGGVVKSVDGGRCNSTIVYVGDWFGRPADYSLTIDWTKVVEVAPFFTDPARSHIKILVAAQDVRNGLATPIAGFVINAGSESMETRLTKALQVIAEGCRPKSSTGF